MLLDLATPFGDLPPPVTDGRKTFYELALKNIRENTDVSLEDAMAQKFELLSYGLTSTKRAWDEVRRTGKYPQRVRSGASCGLDVVLPGEVWVNAPVYDAKDEPAAPLLDFEDGQFFITSKNSGRVMPLAVVPKPKYYDDNTTTNRPMNFIGQMFADRIGFGLTNNCYFWKKERRCAFCTIGTNTEFEDRDKPVLEIVETLIRALDDEVLPPRHILLSGGTFPRDGWTTRPFAEAAREIRKVCDLPIYLMAVPPADLGEFKELHHSGITEIALNIEIYSPELAEKIIPGKKREVGVDRYVEAIKEARKYWRQDQVRSLLVAGLEPLKDTLEGTNVILEAGGTPILSAFRPLPGSELANHPKPSPQWFEELYYKGKELSAKYGADLGPACAACRANCVS
jgi:hypothetical protein